MRLLQLIFPQISLPGELSQWTNLAMNAIALLLFLAGLALALWRSYRERRGAAEEELQSFARARNILRTLLECAVGGLVTQAEHTYGAGTGEIKKSAVLAELLRLLPEEYRTEFSTGVLESMIEQGLVKAKKLWPQAEK